MSETKKPGSDAERLAAERDAALDVAASEAAGRDAALDEAAITAAERDIAEVDAVDARIEANRARAAERELSVQRSILSDSVRRERTAASNNAFGFYLVLGILVALLVLAGMYAWWRQPDRDTNVTFAASPQPSNPTVVVPPAPASTPPPPPPPVVIHQQAPPPAPAPATPDNIVTPPGPPADAGSSAPANESTDESAIPVPSSNP